MASCEMGGSFNACNLHKWIIVSEHIRIQQIIFHPFRYECSILSMEKHHFPLLFCRCPLRNLMVKRKTKECRDRFTTHLCNADAIVRRGDGFFLSFSALVRALWMDPVQMLIHSHRWPVSFSEGNQIYIGISTQRPFTRKASFQLAMRQ